VTSGGTTGIATWRDPGWRPTALEWAAGQLARSGLEPAGEPEQPHVRTWSTAFRLPLRGGGAAWLKAVGLGSAQEPVLAGALGLPAGDPALGRLRDAYLEPWSPYGTPGS